MKKFFILSFLLLTTSLFSETYKDGLYVAKAEKPTYNWTSVVEITITNGEISKVEAEDYSVDNKKRTNDVQGNQFLKSKYGYDFNDIVSNFTKQLTSEKSLSNIDQIAGATVSNNNFKLLSEKALKDATLGNTQASIINKK